MNAASLMVSISADVSNFSRNISKAERDAQRGFRTISTAAKEMTEFITVPLLAAGLEFAHLAAEAQDAAARLDRVFGSAAGEVRKQLEEMTSVIPETVESLSTLAVKSDNMLQGLGYGAEKAASLSVSMVKLAGDMAAFAHVPVGDALDALDKGLAGKTRGLIQFGIVLSQQAIHQEALKRGLVDNHRVLTELGTAEIAEYLIRQKATRITGEAERTAGQASNAFKFLKVSVHEMGETIGTITLPAVVGLVHGLKALVDVIKDLPTGLTTAMVALGGVALAIGPLVAASLTLVRTWVALRAATAVLSGGASIGAIIGAITTAPILSLVVALGALALAFEAVRGAAQGYANIGQLLTGTLGDDEAEAVTAAGWTKQYAAIRALHDKRLAKKTPKKDGPLSTDNRSALDIFKDHAALVQDQYKNAVDMGLPLESSMQRINALHAEAARLLAKQGDKWTDMAKAAADAVRATQGIIDTVAVAGAMAGRRPTAGLIGDASRRAATPTEISLSLAQGAIGEESSLRSREAALRMAETFQVARQAAASLGEHFRDVSRAFAVGIAQFKGQWGAGTRAGVDGGGLHIGGGLAGLKLPPIVINRSVADSAMSGLKEATASFMASLTPGALAAQAAGLVFQQLTQLVSALMEPFTALGHILAIEITPILRPLFEALKALGIVTALVGEVLYSVAGGIARVIGGLIVAIGKFISKIPFLGGVGNGIQDFGNGILTLGQSFQETASQLDTARRQLQDAQFGALANAANQATNALYNVPQGFRVALAQYQAGQPAMSGSKWYPSSSGSGAASADNRPIVLVLDGKVIARSTLKVLRNTAQNKHGDSTRWSELMAV